MSQTIVSWFSRHRPLPAQERELQRLFGRHMRIAWDPDVFCDAADIAARFQRSGAREMVIVAPLALVAKLLDLGLRPLWSDMREVDGDFAAGHPDSCVSAPRGRWFEFVRFRRLVGIEMTFEDLEEQQ